MQNFIYVGGQLVKTLFAHVDGKQNFAFVFQPGFGDSDIYPSMYSTTLSLAF